MVVGACDEADLQAAQAVAEGGDASGAVAMAKLAATRAAQQAVDAIVARLVASTPFTDCF